MISHETLMRDASLVHATCYWSGGTKKINKSNLVGIGIVDKYFVWHFPWYKGKNECTHNIEDHQNTYLRLIGGSLWRVIAWKLLNLTGTSMSIIKVWDPHVIRNDFVICIYIYDMKRKKNYYSLMYIWVRPPLSIWKTTAMFYINCI